MDWDRQPAASRAEACCERERRAKRAKRSEVGRRSIARGRWSATAERRIARERETWARLCGGDEGASCRPGRCLLSVEGRRAEEQEEQRIGRGTPLLK